MRQQEILGWLLEELSLEVPALPKFTIRANPEETGPALRDLLRVSIEAQREFPTPAKAFQGWLQAVEDRSVFVFRFSMGKDSCRAFSMWDDRAPVIAINTAWSPEARTFSLMHELGHLTTRTNSACLEGELTRKSDPTERWCEHLAAALLLPLNSVKESLRVRSSPGGKVEIQAAVTLAKRYRVSVPAAALRLIEADLADWDLYKSIPKDIDDKSGFGRSTEPRIRARIRQEQFGRRATNLYLQALEAEVLGRTDLVNYLDLADDDIERLQSVAS